MRGGRVTGVSGEEISRNCNYGRLKTHPHFSYHVYIFSTIYQLFKTCEAGFKVNVSWWTGGD